MTVSSSQQPRCCSGEVVSGLGHLWLSHKSTSVWENNSWRWKRFWRSEIGLYISYWCFNDRWCLTVNGKCSRLFCTVNELRSSLKVGRSRTHPPPPLVHFHQSIYWFSFFFFFLYSFFLLFLCASADGSWEEDVGVVVLFFPHLCTVSLEKMTFPSLRWTRPPRRSSRDVSTRQHCCFAWSCWLENTVYILDPLSL